LERTPGVGLRVVAAATASDASPGEGERAAVSKPSVFE